MLKVEVKARMILDLTDDMDSIESVTEYAANLLAAIALFGGFEENDFEIADIKVDEANKQATVYVRCWLSIDDGSDEVNEIPMSDDDSRGMQLRTLKCGWID